MIYLKIKRVLDTILAFLALIILSPIMLTLVLIIKIDSRGPIFFKQRRIGKNKRIFLIYKFRTMRVDTPKDTPTHKLENPDKWITKIGKFLRKTSLDELPQIINILKGQMSIVGPRPALWNQYDLVEERDKYGVYRLDPGLTGLSQVNGRDELPIFDKAKLDGYYNSHISIWLDIKIFFTTIVQIFKPRGIVEGRTDSTTKSNEVDIK